MTDAEQWPTTPGRVHASRFLTNIILASFLLGLGVGLNHNGVLVFAIVYVIVLAVVMHMSWKRKRDT